MSPTRREWLAIAGVAALAAGAGAVVGPFILQSEGGAADLLAARFTDLQGKPRRIADLRGSPVICNFWATWCAPCREEVPILAAAQQQYAQKGLLVVGIGLDDATKIREFAANFGVNYSIFVGTAEVIQLMRKLGNPTGGLPYNVVLDRQGAIVGRKLGAFSGPELRQVIEGLVQ